MQFSVCSREKAKKMAYKLKEPAIIISVTDSDKEPNIFAKNPYIKEICRVAFDDTDPDILLKREVLMRKEDAEKIKECVIRNKDTVERIVVHCEAGVSRSAAIMAAIQLYLIGSADAIFSNPKYCPNFFCFEMMREAFFGENN